MCIRDRAYNQKIREADELGRRLITKVTTEFNPRANLEPYLIDVYKEISKAFKGFLGAKNLAITLRKDSPFLKREKVQQLGRINPDGDVFKYVFFDIDRTKIKGDEKANEQLDKFEESSIKSWTLVHTIRDPTIKALQENKISFRYVGKDYPYIIERDRGNYGRELGVMNRVEGDVSDFLDAYFVKKLYSSLSDYFFGIGIPIISDKGVRIGDIEVDALDIDLPELIPSKFLIDMREKYAKYKKKERPIIRAGTVKLLKKPENKARKEIIERAYAMEKDEDPDKSLWVHGYALLTRTEWNQILEEAGMKNPFRNKLIKTKDFIGYEIGEEEKKLYDEFFFLENRPVRAYKLKAAQHLADLIAPVLMTASKYYEVKQVASEDLVTTIETKTREFYETIAHRLGNQINALRMGVINRMKRQGNKLFPHLKEIRPLMDEVSEYVTELSEIVKQGGFNEEKRQEIDERIQTLKNKFENVYENIQEPSELLEQLIEKAILDFESVSRTLKLFEPKEPATRNIYETLDEHIQQDHFLGDAGIKLKGKRADIKVTASYSLLHEVYNIILENAREAILEKRKKVPDYVGEIEYGVEEFDKEHVLVYVKDDALGIPEGVDVFSRAYTTKGERHGLGLDLARYLMGEMNGSIAIRNRNQVSQKDKNNYEATSQEQPETKEQGTIVELVLPKRPYYDVFEATFLKDTYRDE